MLQQKHESQLSPVNSNIDVAIGSKLTSLTRTYPMMILRCPALSSECVHVPLGLHIVLSTLPILPQHLVPLRPRCFDRNICDVLLPDLMCVGIGGKGGSVLVTHDDEGHDDTNYSVSAS